MARIIFLDAGPLGQACNELKKDEVLAVWNWIWNQADGGARIVIPEIADYEIRRELLLNEFRASLTRLDSLNGSPCVYLPITTSAIRRAAELWARARVPRGGGATAGGESIDGDAILAAQALVCCSDADDWWIATSNVKHLSRYVGDHARLWQQIPPSQEVRDVYQKIKGQQRPDS